MDNKNDTENTNLADLNGKYDSKVFKDVNFTEQKNIKQVSLTNVDFFDCDFSNVLISGCEFKKCRFIRCKFNKARLLNVKFSCDLDDPTHPTIISECTFEENTFWDVTIDKNCTFDKNDFIGEKYELNNFWLRGEKIEEINKLISVVETVEEQVEDPLRTNRKIESEKDVNGGQTFEREVDLVEDMKLYNVLFPAVMKQYPDLKKTDGDEEYCVFVNDIEFAFCQDEEANCWRGLFFVRGTDDLLGSTEVMVSSDKVITFDTAADAFKNIIKDKAADIMKQTQSDIIKNSIQEFVKIVFKETNIVTEDIDFTTVVFIASENPNDVIGDFNCGYDFETKELVTIIGQPFASNDTLMAQKMKDFAKKFVNGTIRDDYMGGNYETPIQQTYSIQNGYSVYVIKQSPICTNAYLKPFNKQHVVILKK